MNPHVSVIVCTYNDEKYIGECIESILRQTFEDFEFIIVNDGSTDKTHDVIVSYSDPRIRYVRLTANCGAIGKVRNIAVGYVRGEYVFFTDGDCHAKEDWIQQGLKAFEKHGSRAIEGRLVYYKEGYRRTLADRDIYNETGGWWPTANMAFHRDIFEEFNFDPSFRREEDREFALRIMKVTEIPFVPTCITYHQKIRRNIGVYIRESHFLDLTEKIRLIRMYNDRNEYNRCRFRVISPLFLLIIFFPPIILGEFLVGKIRSWDDIKLLPFMWVKAIYMRYLIWKAAITERYFII